MVFWEGVDVTELPHEKLLEVIYRLGGMNGHFHTGRLLDLTNDLSGKQWEKVNKLSKERNNEVFKFDWPFMTEKRHNKIVEEVIADYQAAIDEAADGAVKTSEHLKSLVESLSAANRDRDAAHKELCGASGKFTTFMIEIANAGARIESWEGSGREQYFMVYITPKLAKERGTLDSFMLQFYKSLMAILPDRWEWNGDLQFKKSFYGIYAIEKAPEKIREITTFLQGELDALYATIRRQGVAEAMKEKKVTGPDVRD
jgi:hypothetical protein